MTRTNTATPTKLRSGEWGARVQGAARVGDEITITTRAGKSWSARVAAVVWSGEGVSIVATESGRGRSGGRRSGGRYVCEECGDWVSAGTTCWETGCTH